MPFADETFDVVTCLDVIEHTPDDTVSLAELLRVTKPGGALIVTVPVAVTGTPGEPRLRVADGPPCEVPFRDMTALWEGPALV